MERIRVGRELARIDAERGERGAQREIGGRVAELPGRADRHEGPARLGVAHERAREGALADASLAADDDEATAPLACAAERRANARERGVASDELGIGIHPSRELTPPGSRAAQPR